MKYNIPKELEFLFRNFTSIVSAPSFYDYEDSSLDVQYSKVPSSGRVSSAASLVIGSSLSDFSSSTNVWTMMDWELIRLD